MLIIPGLDKLIRITIAVLVGVVFLAGCTNQEAAPEINIEYGKIKSKTPFSNNPPRGATVAGYRQLEQVPITKLLDTTQVAQNVAQVSANAGGYVYEIEKTNGSIIKLATEKGFFVERDCVAIERTSLTNLRLVDDSVCRDLKKQQAMRRTHSLAAHQCELAKRQVILAQSDREVFKANEDVIRLCQFTRKNG